MKWKKFPKSQITNLKKEEYLEYYKVAFFHHPCSLFEECSGSNYDGIINNALEVSKRLAQWDVNLILHGHKHWAKQSIFRPAGEQKIYMLAAGSLGKYDLSEHSGNMIEIKEKKILLKRIGTSFCLA